MKTLLEIDILPQPDDSTCGPTSLQAVYRYLGDEMPLEQVVREVGTLAAGGTLAMLLGQHALHRGYDATIYTYDLRMFDPSWFDVPGVDVADKLRRQMDLRKRRSEKFELATRGYLEFLRLGGEIRFEDLNPALISGHLEQGTPILTGLSATYLYRSPRERGSDFDDLRGEPQGHFVVLAGYDAETRAVRVADPLQDNPRFGSHYYDVDIEHLVGAIFLGIVTYDANLLMVTPRTDGP